MRKDARYRLTAATPCEASAKQGGQSDGGRWTVDGGRIRSHFHYHFHPHFQFVFIRVMSDVAPLGTWAKNPVFGIPIPNPSIPL